MAWSSVSNPSVPRVPPGPRFIRLAVGVIVALLLAGHLAFVALYLPRERRQLRSQWESRLAALADDRAAAVEAWVAERAADATTIAAFPSAVHLAAGVQGPPYPFPAETGPAGHLRDIFATAATAYGYRGVYLLSARGEVLAASQAAPPLESGCLEVARRAFAREGPTVDMHVHEGSPLVVAATAPVHARDATAREGRVVGAVLLAADPENWLFPFLAGEPTPTRTGETILVRRQGDQVQFLSPLRHRRVRPGHFSVPFETPRLAARDALEGVETVNDYMDYRGVPVLAATRRLHGVPWALVVKVDRAEVLAPLAEEAPLVAATGWAFLLAIVLAVMALYRVRSAQYEAALAADRARFASLLDQVNDAIFFVGKDGRIREANRRAEELYGYPRHELIGKSVLTDLRPPATQPDAPTQLARGLENGEVRFETLHRSADGTLIPVEVNSRRARWGDEEGMLSVVRDTSERRAAEEERGLTLAVLQLGATARDPRELAREAVALVREHAGLEAVGVRLESDGDFPYAAAEGFPQSVVELENQLRAMDTDGKPLHDADGQPLLEGMCGAVISARMDPGKPWVTPGGSFWTPGWTALLADASEAERGIMTRGRCREAGFESVALIPLRVGEQTLGLLHLADRRRGYLTREAVARWERVAGHLAIAFSKLRAEEAVRLAEVRYRELFDHSASCVVVYRAVDDGDDFEIVACNRLAEKAEGVARDAVLGRRVTEVFPGVAAFGLLDVFRQVFRTGQSARHPVSLYVDEQHSGWRDNYVCKLPSGEVVTIYEDVTERVLAERALRESEERYRDLVENLNDVMYRVRGDGTVVFLNRAIERVLGFTPDELVGTNLVERIHPDDVDAVRKAFQAILAGAQFPSEYRFFHKDGSIRWVRTSSRPWRVNDEIAGIQGVLTDITDRREAEQRLAEQVEELRRWQVVTLGREERILALKREVNEALARAGLPPRYATAAPAGATPTTSADATPQEATSLTAADRGDDA